MIYRLVCLNGSIHASIIKRRHVGRKSQYSDDVLLTESQEFLRDATRQADDRAFFLKVQDLVAAALTQERLDKNLLAMQGAVEAKIEADPVKVVEVTAERFGLGDSERGSILKHLIQGGDLSKFGLANAVTRASQDVEDYTLATQMESMGGQIIEMPKNDWAVLAV
jgi:hypothetical protein